MTSKIEKTIETIIGICIMCLAMACAMLAIAAVVYSYAVVY